MTPLVSVLRASGRNAGLTVAALGVAVLVGWVFDVQTLKSVAPGLATMKANTAIALALAGVALALLAQSPLEPRRRRAAQVLSGAVALVGLLTLGEYLTGRSFGIAELVFTDPPGDAAFGLPGRMAINTALAFVLLGLA